MQVDGRQSGLSRDAAIMKLLLLLLQLMTSLCVTQVSCQGGRTTGVRVKASG